MSALEYEYAVEDCDVPKVRRASLSEYRGLRQKCLEYIRGDTDTSVTNQIYDLTWHTAVFRTLNEARRIEPQRPVNGALWELTSAGYASLMTLGIRKLVDRDPRTDSVWNIIDLVERRPELLTREKYVCYDGIPYDYEAVGLKELSSLGADQRSRAHWLPRKGPRAWAVSEMLHQAFDKLCGNPKKRRRSDKVQMSILVALKEHLSHPAIQTVCGLADRRVAHAERISEHSVALPTVTYNDIDTALRQVVRVANFLSSMFFYDAAFGSVVATPQFDVLAALDEPWVTSPNVSALHTYWDDLCASMDNWAYNVADDFLPAA